jgi:plasmid maintenance system antidote protein VapI
MVIGLSKAFGSTPETWLRIAHDLAAARKNGSKIKVHRQHVENFTCSDRPA